MEIRKIKLILVAICTMFVISSCEKNVMPNIVHNHFTFIAKEQVIEVTPQTKSIRIEGHFEIEVDNAIVDYAPDMSSAKIGEHFIDKHDGYAKTFTAIDDNLGYYEIELIPENITSELTLVYVHPKVESYPEETIYQHTIILRPIK